MPPPTTTSSGRYDSSRVTLGSDELGSDASDRLVDELATAVLGVATQHAVLVDPVLARPS